MGRVIIRDLLIFVLVGLMVFTMLFGFVVQLGANYGVEVPEQYRIIDDNVSASHNTLYQEIGGIQNETEGSSGIEESSTGDEFIIGRDIIGAVKRIFSIPSVVTSFINDFLSLFPADPIVAPTLIAIIIILVTFGIISLIARRDI